MSDDPGFDAEALARLERMVGPDSAREILSLFFQHAPRRIADSVAHGEKGDLTAVADELHALKSSAGMVGAKRLQTLADECEHAARKNRVGAVDRLLAEIDREYDRVQALLRDTGMERER